MRKEDFGPRSPGRLVPTEGGVDAYVPNPLAPAGREPRLPPDLSHPRWRVPNGKESRAPCCRPSVGGGCRSTPARLAKQSASWRWSLNASLSLHEVCGWTATQTSTTTSTS